MSRALFLSLDEGQVVAKCLSANVGISAIERLPAGGVRLVCSSSDGAEVMKKKFKSHMLPDTAKRQNHRPNTPLW